MSAVDPVAVLTIFDEIRVNKRFYFLVFGESLFNDGVSVVLYNAMVGLDKNQNAGLDQYFMAVLSFFFVAGGGLMIGFIIGAFSAFFCKFTGHTRVIEPLVILFSGMISSLLFSNNKYIKLFTINPQERPPSLILFLRLQMQVLSEFA